MGQTQNRDRCAICSLIAQLLSGFALMDAVHSCQGQRISNRSVPGFVFLSLARLGKIGKIGLLSFGNSRLEILKQGPNGSRFRRSPHNVPKKPAPLVFAMLTDGRLKITGMPAQIQSQAPPDVEQPYGTSRI